MVEQGFKPMSDCLESLYSFHSSKHCCLRSYLQEQNFHIVGRIETQWHIFCKLIGEKLSHSRVWEAIPGCGQWTTISKGNRFHIIFLSSTLNVRTQGQEPLNASVPLQRPSEDFKFRETFGGGLAAFGEAICSLANGLSQIGRAHV